MITAQELRIGNWILYGGCPNKVMGINSPKPDKSERFNGKWILEINPPDSFYVSIEEIEPIPLTEEWLLKMGFEDPTILQFAGIKCKPEPYYICDIRNLQVRTLTMQKGYMVEIVNSFTLPHIKYVHQLQNLYFALTQKELKINL